MSLMLGYGNLFTGCLASGGFYSSGLSGIAGLLMGTTMGAARDVAVPIVEPEFLAKWATEQAQIVSSITSNKILLENCASTIRACGGSVGNLPIARKGDEWVTFDDLANWQDVPDEIIFLLPDKRQQLKALDGMIIESNVISAQISFSHLSYNDAMRPLDWIPQNYLINISLLKFHSVTLLGVVIEALAVAWHSSATEVYESSSFSGSISGKIERQVGIYNGQPINEEVAVFRKPGNVLTD